MSKSTVKIPYKYNTPKFITDRGYGFRRKLGYNNDIAVKLYRNLDAYSCDIPSPKQQANQGGIFNLEFSLDGGLLVAACEEKAVLVYDAANQRLVHTINQAHYNCVNCVRFLDNHTFATCSDDNTIKLWDTRHLSQEKRTLQGHSNWVKNIEYSEKEQVMVTSAFDGTIHAWDLNSPTEHSVLFDKIFIMDGLMRTKLTPDSSKMIICTTNGYMIIIHDLNLKYLVHDLKRFRPLLYRLMQSSEQTFPAATVFNYLFSPDRTRNRLEFIDDFPNEAELISSLQIHPMGWCAVSRNINAGEDEEWTSVHDIQTRDPKDYKDAFIIRQDAIDVSNLESETDDHRTDRPTDIWMGFTSNEQLSAQRAAVNLSIQDHQSMGIINSGLIGRSDYKRHFQKYPDDRFKIMKNIPRLTHFVSEKNVGKGYIKELCFSSDGRIICSPYDKGVRLLGFNEQLDELCYCVPDKPRTLFTLAEMNDYHPDVVVCCKFSPKHYQLVSGCLGGDIIWYRPIL